MRGKGLKFRLIIGAIIVAFAFIKRCGNKTVNPYTNRVQNINMEPNEEIAIGRQSAPQMAKQHGGLHPDTKLQELIDDIGEKLVNSSMARETPYQYDFHLLADEQTINAFALPGGQIFMTYGLLSKLQNKDQVAGVLGHEIGHVLGRHSAERIADSEFWKTLSTGASVGADAGGIVNQFGNNTLLKNGREDEIESDELGVLFMINAGYNPNEMISVMQVLKAAAGPNRVPEFKSSHPDPENRIAHIKEAIEKYSTH